MQKKTYQNITFENYFYKLWTLLVSQGSGAGKIGKGKGSPKGRKATFEDCFCSFAKSIQINKIFSGFVN